MAAAIPGASRPAIHLPEDSQLPWVATAPLLQYAGRLIPAAVVHDHDLVVLRVILLQKRR
jgi:hypothetical protein